MGRRLRRSRFGAIRDLERPACRARPERSLHRRRGRCRRDCRSQTSRILRVQRSGRVPMQNPCLRRGQLPGESGDRCRPGVR